MKDGVVQYPRGSVWRKWDLHMHTPASWDWKGGARLAKIPPADRDAAADQILDALEATDVAVFAIQDHWTFAGYQWLRERLTVRGKPFTKTLLPGVELHLEAPTPHLLDYHVIFSPEIPADRLTDFLAQLEMPNGKSFSRHDLVEYARSLDNGKKRQYGVLPADNPTDDDLLDAAYQCARVTRQSVIVALDKLPKNAAVIMLPYSTSGGFERLDWKKHPAEDQAFLHRAHMFEARSNEDIALFRGEETPKNTAILPDFIQAIGGSPKACVSGTDAHNDAGYGVYPSDRYTWIKADPTFAGLLHAIIEPRDRVHIGEVPRKLRDIQAFPSHYMDRIVVQRKKNAPLLEKWFTTDLLVNPGLVAVIGNKGSGKSALTDIAALLGNSHSTAFSFLNDQRFRKRPENRSQHFIASLRWSDDTTSERGLDQGPVETEPERVQYLPQQRIEDLCNEIVTEGRDARFEEELRAVVFAHVPADERLGAANLNELIDRKSAGILAELEERRTSMRSLNHRIAELEQRLHPDAVARIEAAIAQKDQEVAALDKAKPVAVAAPGTAKDADAEAAMKAMEGLLKTKGEFEAKVQELTKRRGVVLARQAAIKSVQDRVQALEQNIARIRREMEPDLARASLRFDDIVTFGVNRAPLDKCRADAAGELEEIDTLLGATDGTGLTKKLREIEGKAAEAKGKLDAPMRKYQEYTAALADWQKKRDGVVGTPDVPGSLEALRGELKYLKEKAAADLEGLRKERWASARQIVETLGRQTDVKRELYAPVQRFLESKDFDHSRLKLEFAVATAVNRFVPDFLGMINQGRSGSFMGVDDGRKLLEAIVSRHSYDTPDSVCGFLEDVLGALAKDHRDNQARKLETQLKRERSPADLYNLLFAFEWLRPHYTLQLDGKPIGLLSPGEKGALLIVFYLLLDPANTPLILDQPEHNLDNESIMHLLVPCFREAARRRQVVVVTHNPNLAVVADADQIIHARIDKQDGNRVDYTSGSLESNIVSTLAVNVLEGTLPAFRKRGQKYEINPAALK